MNNLETRAGFREIFRLAEITLPLGIETRIM